MENDTQQNEQTSQESTQTQPEQPSPSEKKLPKWVLIIPILTLVTGLAAFVFMNNSQEKNTTTQRPTTQQSAPTISQIQNQTDNPDSIEAGWETYSSSTFTFKYPKTYTDEQGKQYTASVTEEESTATVIYSPDDNNGFELTLISVTTDQTKFQNFENPKQCEKPYPRTIPCVKGQPKPVTIDGNSASSLDVQVADTFSAYFIQTSQEPFVEINAGYGYEAPRKLFAQTLSTFKFTNSQSTQTNTISWQEAVELINTCQVDLAFQTHALDVTLTLKDGTQATTKEPTIDDIFDVVKQAEPTCGTIPLATE